MKSEQSVHQALVALLDRTVEDLAPADIEWDSDLKDDLDIDSLARLEVIAAIEEHWSIKVPEEDAEELHTVRQTVDYIIEATNTPA
ncbi:acyl carrier protein [Streptomyces fulvorobeus]|uniref:Acyl carrier protein n=1 Tax=Streptomyces fulvorobeus TaxID=284028 RepID=A0A7J0C5F4_9ACTN|nr:phosphopantetheine-binding protein [Streptomyces fulvorobeus]NYE40637.1 acyl carrier protein [Streptomyces fulvorobeus]GFM96936.1 acyl carrier protein [Streptomyces fulvorobeus]